jgi:hypothetical protein
MFMYRFSFKYSSSLASLPLRAFALSLFRIRIALPSRVYHRHTPSAAAADHSPYSCRARQRVTGFPPPQYAAPAAIRGFAAIRLGSADTFSNHEIYVVIFQRL